MFKLNDKYQLRKEDQSLFNFEEAKLIEFNNIGFSILLKLIDGEEFKPSEDEKTFINQLLEANILIDE